MNWQDVLNDKSLQDLPYKIELNERGQIVMSPASTTHSRFETRIASLMEKYKKDGEAIVECPIETAKGVKVADVVWASDEFIKKYDGSIAYNMSPEICVEIISPSNIKDEINEKVILYFSKGAKEVWICDENGNVEFHTIEGVIKKSKIIPKFPKKIKL